MKTIIFVPEEGKNFTPDVASALDSLGESGGELIFEKGEYHFYRDGAWSGFIPVSNNTSCDKHVIFPIFGMKNVTIDGRGSAFIFHEITFPFAVRNSEGVTLKNFSTDTALSPIGLFKIGEISDEGFYFHIDKEKTPYRIENGALVFKRENRERSGIDNKFSLHGVSQWGVQYLFTGDCRDSTENLPAKHVLVDAEERSDGLFLKYRKNNIYGIGYSEGATVSAILDGGRSSDVILLDSSKDVLVKDVTVRHGIGMGIIAELSENIEIDGFRTDSDYHGDGATLTADSMHFVNCSGKLEIYNCKITHTMDDAINVHGMYTRVTKIDDSEITVRIGHAEQYYFNPYRDGDVLLVLDDSSFDYTARLKVLSSCISDDGTCITLMIEKLFGEIRVGELLESAERMPDVHVHDNTFFHYPHLRISGSGDILIENNSFAKATGALLVKDLAKYWYESGRVRNLIFRNNVMNGCNELGGTSFITADVDGLDHSSTPKVHGRIEISGNKFKNIKDKAIVAAGISELVIKGNEFPPDEGIIVIDGKNIKP